MSNELSKPVTAFVGAELLRSGPLVEVALAVKAAAESGGVAALLVFDDATGRVIDLDLRGTKADVIDRLTRPSPEYGGRRVAARTSPSLSDNEGTQEPRGRGRPKLGVVPREVTLLPRQWEWLSAQPGGASAVLRRLVDDAKRQSGPQQKRRADLEAAYHFLLAMAGDLPDYEEATRALFADDRARLEQRIAAWPEDIRSYALRLAFGRLDMPQGERGQIS